MGVPSLTRSLAVDAERSYMASLSNTPTLVFAGQGNTYAFFVENNSAVDIFIQMFNKAAAVDVTLGTTVPDQTFRIPASAGFGKDANDSPLLGFDKGLVVAVSSSRTGSGAPSSPATATFWYWNHG